MTPFLAPLGRTLDGLVHVSAADDPLMALRHRSFMATHLAVGLVALSAFPLWLAIAGPVSMTVAGGFAWLTAPLALVAFLSRTGRLEPAHLASAVLLTGLIVWLSALTGALQSPVLIWLAVVPWEAALSGSRRIVWASAAITATGAVALGLLANAAPTAAAGLPFGIFVVVAAIFSSATLATRVDALYRDSIRAAKIAEERYRLLADNATDLITRHAANGDVEFASPAARTLLGLPTSAVLGDGLFRRVHVADRPAYLSALSQAYNSKTASAVEFRLRRNGLTVAEADQEGFVTVEMRCRPAFDADGGTCAVVAVTRDVAAQKAEETELRAAGDAAARANAAKTQFLAHMSHELRTPLNAIIGFSEILEREVIGRLDYERRREYAKLIHASGEHLLQVVNGILDISKIESGMFDIVAEPLAIGPIIDGCSDIMAHQAAQRGIRVNRDIPATLPELVADRRAIRQILLNLLSNAIKFTDAGGSITIGARVEGGAMVLFVSDTGIGISAGDLPRLGTPFVQAESAYDRRYEGTGLGLSMVKGLAALHGGALAIESALGAGTTVTVTLPIDDTRRDGARVSALGLAVSPERDKELKRA